MADNSTPNDDLGFSNRNSKRARAVLFLCLLQSVVLVLLALKYAGLWNASQGLVKPSPVRTVSVTNQEPFFRGHPGPWGNLEFARINIEPPDEFVEVDDRLFEPTQWYFADYDRAKLGEFFKLCGLTPFELAQLPDSTAWKQTSNAVIVVPSPKLILGLSPSVRSKIYSVLALDPHNDFQFWPFTFRRGGFEEWFGSAGLSPATTELVRKLVYQRGDSICFSDLPEVFPLISGIPERRRLVKTLSRNASLLMKVRITPASNVDELTSYWVGRGRKKDIRPLLESLTDITNGIGLDVVHLLPPFARKRVNTYPDPPTATNPQVPDCFWSSLNFFNDPPDERYRDDSVWRRELTEDYATVTEPTYGDLVFLLRPDGSPIHCAVYVADDVVFTKNGGNFRQPWILMKMEDMLARYPEPFSIRTVIYHLKKRPEAKSP